MLMEPIRVEVEPDEGDDLLEALSLRGLESRLLRSEERVEVELSPPAENWELWNLEVVAALEGWLEEAQRDSVVARTGTRTYTVRAPRPLAGAPASTRVPRDEAPEPPDNVPAGTDDTVTARMPALPAFEGPVGPVAPVGVAEPAVRARSRPVIVAAAVATVLLAAVGLAVLAVVLMQVL
jgi:hypothetical protein